MTALYAFDGGPLRALEPPETWALRYATWTPDGASALIVGNRGKMMRFSPPSRFERLDSGVTQNLRGAAWSPDGGRALIVGNRGTVLSFDGASFAELHALTMENLRRVAWAPDGSCALIVGNGGCVLRFDARTGAIVQVPGDRAHTMRSIGWRPDGAYALIGGYASRHAGYPRPYVLYRCDGRFVQGILATDDEDDAIAIDWRPGTHPARALVLITRSGEVDAPLPGKIVEYDGSGFGYRTLPRYATREQEKMKLPGLVVQLLGLGWHPSGEYAVLCGERGKLLQWDGRSMKQVASGVSHSLVGPFWQPAAERPIALLLKGPEEKVYTV
jgi:WD40 repeat protein